MENLLKSLLLMSACGSALGLLLMLLRRILGKRLPYSFYYYAWLLVLLRLMLPLPGLIPTDTATTLPSRQEESFFYEELEQPAYIAEIETEEKVLTEREAVKDTVSIQQAPNVVPEAENIPVTKVSSAPAFSMATLISILKTESFWLRLWVFGAVLYLMRYALAYMSFSRLLRRSLREPTNEDIELYSSLPGYGKPELFRCVHVTSPMLLGLFRPILLLPDRDYPKQTIENVLLHELSHYRRKDIIYKWAVIIISALHWFNPLLLLFRKEIDRCCELCCDEHILRGMDTKARMNYGNALLDLAAAGVLPKNVVAGAFTTEKRDLKERLEQIMKYNKASRATAVMTVLALLLLCGCGAALGPAEGAESPSNAVPTPAPVEVTEEVIQVEGSREIVGGEVTVSNVEEFLAAISSDTTIVLEPGTYILSEAESYGSQISGGWYTWLGGGAEYELVIKDVSNFKIKAQSPEDTSIVTSPRYANVLRFIGCSGIELSGVTVGHSEAPGVCFGGVVRLENSENILIDNCALFGCGVIGVDAENCDNINVTDSRIYDCSWSGTKLVGCSKVLFDNCEFFDCGKDKDANSVFEFANSKQVAVVNSKVYDNSCSTLIISSSSSDVSFLGTAFYNNDAAYGIAASNYSPVISDCSFINSNIKQWYGEESEFAVKAVDSTGQELSGEMLEAMHRMEVSFDGFDTTIDSREMREVQVSTMEEFLAAIGPNTTVYLADGVYDVSPGDISAAEYYHWEETFDGYQLVIKFVENFRIAGSGKDKCSFSAVPRYADVLRFENCKNISLSGFTAGHTEEPGFCLGDVLAFSFCDDISIDSCGLYGCGVIGIDAESCTDLEVKYTEIYDCSSVPVNLRSVENASFVNCDIHDCGNNNEFIIFDSKNVTVKG